MNIFIIFLFTAFSNAFSGALIKSLYSEKSAQIIESTETREVRFLNKNWKVFTGEESKTNVNVPAVFEEASTLNFETSFNVPDKKNKIYSLFFEGIGYSADITVNNSLIYKKTAGEIPFEIELPSDILREGKNTLILKIYSGLDSRTTIPVKQQFLTPRNYSGILRNVYLTAKPNDFLKEIEFKSNFTQTGISIDAEAIISINKNSSSNYRLEYEFTPALNPNGAEKFSFNLPPLKAGETKSAFNINLKNPAVWSPDNPDYYVITASLFINDSLIDRTIKNFSIADLKADASGIFLNGNRFTIRGATYYFNEGEYDNATAQEIINEQLIRIKSAGFNSVRFTGQYPNPYAVAACRKIGLLPLLEMPLNSAPEEIFAAEEYRMRYKAILGEMLRNYSSYSNIFIVGLGSSFLPNSEKTKNFIDEIATDVKQKGYVAYASFAGIPDIFSSGLSLYGIELYSYPIEKNEAALDELEHPYFISQVTYPDYYGNASGYLVNNSTQAQAYYFDKFLDLTLKRDFGFVINTVYNFKSSHSSFYGGYSDDYYTRIALFNRPDATNSLSYRVVESRLKNLSGVTIPIGTSVSENKPIFILISLGLSILMAFVINWRKKFKEDCSRALFRSYNFFADLRDHRILSGIHTYLLLFIEVGSMALLFTILLYYLRTNILFEKLLVDIGSNRLIDLISYLAWNPGRAFVSLYLFFIVKMFFLSIVLKLFSLPLKNKIDFQTLFYGIVWSFLPFTIVLPVELVLYKILAMDTINLVAIAVLLIMCLWILFRILKAVYVLLETHPLKVYFYGFLSIIAAASVIILYLQITNATIYYFMNTLKEYETLLH
ncbi:sugar-binding domain-containing protein [Melioribacter sp. Ez-97]|uniref:sugar-binding domain-containing protein n=1 Tax=Melioribacter sp. Ez-97 TaxID=3423434 RepID=UPI003ED8944F